MPRPRGRRFGACRSGQGAKTCAFQVAPASEETSSFASGMAPSTTTPWVGSVNPRSVRGAPPPVSVKTVFQVSPPSVVRYR